MLCVFLIPFLGPQHSVRIDSIILFIVSYYPCLLTPQSRNREFGKFGIAVSRPLKQWYISCAFAIFTIVYTYYYVLMRSIIVGRSCQHLETHSEQIVTNIIIISMVKNTRILDYTYISIENHLQKSTEWKDIR